MIRTLPLFVELSNESLERFVAFGERRDARAGDDLIRQGEEGCEMFVLLAGQVSILVSSGGGERLVATLGPGQFFGEMALLDRSVRCATVRAATDVEVLAIPQAAVGWLRESEPDEMRSFVMGLARELSRRLRAMDESLADQGGAG